LASVPGEGTTFILHLPAGHADPLKAPPPMVTLRKRSKAKAAAEGQAKIKSTVPMA